MKIIGLAAIARFPTQKWQLRRDVNKEKETDFNLALPTYEMTPGFKPFTVLYCKYLLVLNNTSR